RRDRSGHGLSEGKRGEGRTSGHGRGRVNSLKQQNVREHSNEKCALTFPDPFIPKPIIHGLEYAVDNVPKFWRV
ncbi:MAG: hypothetical protein ACYS8I_17220, partial [Planctomycetota bacterium]